MKNKILLYFPYQLNKTKSGSSLRPIKIIEAFQKFSNENNYEIILISGEYRERKVLLNKILMDGMLEKILYCYMESSTLPIWITDNDKRPRNYLFEYRFMKLLRKNRIPVGLFYRDIYWKFNEYYPVKQPLKAMMRAIYSYEKYFFDKNITIKYLPSLSMNKYVKFKGNIKALPPGLEMRDSNYHFEKKTIIYVGALTPNNGLNELVNISKLIYKEKLNYKLIIICPKKNVVEYNDIFSNFSSNTEISHAFEDGLNPYYEKSSIAIIPRKKNIYNDFAMPIKLFEYLSFNLPVITSDINEVSEFLIEKSLGFKYQNKSELKEILYNLKEETVYKKYFNNIQKEIYNHTWERRIEQIHEDMLKLL